MLQSTMSTLLPEELPVSPKAARDLSLFFPNASNKASWLGSNSDVGLLAESLADSTSWTLDPLLLSSLGDGGAC
jgi:hypothetical protein